MAQTSSEVYNQIQSLLGQINPELDKLPTAQDYYKTKVNEAYNYNLPNLQNAAGLESKLYEMPGNLMNQYNQEFGGKTGISSSQRVNSILSQLGRQSGVANTAWGLADQAGTRMNDLAETLYNQYKTGIEAKQTKLSPLMSIWDRLYSEEQANKRSASSGSGYTGIDWNKLIDLLGDSSGDTSTNTTTTKPTTKSPSISSRQIANSLKSGTYTKDYLTPKTTVPKANTGSTMLDSYINKIKGL